jgi:hypothetical protein
MALQQHPTESLVSDPASLAIFIRCPSVVFRGNPVPSLFNWLEYLPYVTMAAIVVLILKPQTLSRSQKTFGYSDNKGNSSDVVQLYQGRECKKGGTDLKTHTAIWLTTLPQD